MRRIGIIGCYSHDVILLLAKALKCLGERVVVTDRNEDRVLSACIPLPEGWKAEDYVEYKGMYFSTGTLKEENLREQGTELVDFGFTPSERECNLCNDIVVICDMHIHHMRRIKDARFSRDKVKVCILRDVIPGLIDKEKSITEFLTGLSVGKQIYLWSDYKDIQNRYVCELQYEYSLKNASAGMREAILETTGVLFPEREGKELRRTIRQAERREYH